MREPKMAFDPIPGLASLMASAQRRDAPEAPAKFAARLAEALGLPELATQAEAEAAIRGAIQVFTTKTGRLLPPSELAALAAEAERGYDLPPLRVQYGTLEELKEAGRREGPREMLAAGELSTYRSGRLSPANVADLHAEPEPAVSEPLHGAPGAELEDLLPPELIIEGFNLGLSLAAGPDGPYVGADVEADPERGELVMRMTSPGGTPLVLRLSLGRKGPEDGH